MGQRLRLGATPDGKLGHVTAEHEHMSRDGWQAAYFEHPDERRASSKHVLSTLLRNEMKDKAAVETIVHASGVDRTIVRAPFLTDDPGTGNIHVFTAESTEIAHKLTGADLATFVVAQLSSEEYLQKAVAPGNS